MNGREEFEIDPAEAANAKKEVLAVLAPRLLLTRADEVQARRVKYLWEGRIPNGAMTVMPGEEGVGKTTVGVRLMADLTRGTLTGEFLGHPQNVLIVAAEDGLEVVMRPRLEQAGADLERIWFVKARLDPQDNLAQDVVLPRDLLLLGAKVHEHRVGMVWIDSLVTTLPAQMSSISYQDVSRTLKEINEWANTEGIAVVAPWHLNKGKSSDTAVRMMDSRAFRTTVRSVLLVVPDEEVTDGQTGGIVALDKANAGPLTVPALRYQIMSVPYTVDELDPDTGEMLQIEANVGVAQWTGIVDGDGRAIARAALMPDRQNREPNPADTWLRDYLLEEGKVSRQQVLAAAAEEMGLSVDQVNKAATRLNVHRVHVGTSIDGRPENKAFWSLP